MLKRLVLLSICLLLAGCSWWPWGSSVPEVPPAPKTIGVVSVISGQIAVIDASGGWTRRSVIYPLGDWRIDQVATDQASAWLQQKDFEVRPVTISAGAFGVRALGGPVNRGGLFGKQRPSFSAIIRSSVQPADLDYYLVLVEASGSTGIPDMHGIGLVHFSGKPQAFVLYHAFLIDGKTGETIDDVHADGNNAHSGLFTDIDGPNTDLPKAAWPHQIDAWSAEQQTAFRDAIVAELTNNLKETLPRLSLP